MKYTPFLLGMLVGLLLFTGCRKEAAPEESFTVSVRIKTDPSFLNPLKSMGQLEGELTQYLFLPLADYHPASLQLIPILIDTIPVGIVHTDGTHAGRIEFRCRFREEAKWDDGSPITAQDYLFTVKAIKLEQLQIAPAIRSIFGQMLAIEPDSEDPRAFSVFLDKDFLLAKELAVITEVMPAYRYDPEGALAIFDIRDGLLAFPEPPDSTQLTRFDRFVETFNHADNGRKWVEGSGPYRLESWQTKQRISLIRKENYWGSAFPLNPYLNQHPERILFEVYPDDQAAFTAIQNGTLDVIGGLDGFNYSRLKADERAAERISFYTQPLQSYYFIAINNDDEMLKDKNLRKALARLIDVETFIQNQESGLGVRLQGPILPSRQYYNDTLEPIPYDPEGARQLLTASGWTDSNGNGTIDKQIDGKRMECSLEILITGKPLGKNMALTLKERASEVGIDIRIVTRDARLVREDIAARKFDLYPNGLNYGLYPEDLYQSWHSDNYYPGGSNKYGFEHPKIDSIIEEIRETLDSTKLDHLYREFQAVVYEEQPSIFLYAPTNNILVSKRLEPLITAKQPGYFLNAFRIH